MTNNLMSIWNHVDIAEKIKPEFRLSLGEGGTPVEIVNIEGTEVVFKREDLNPNRSFKDRSLAYQISKYYQDGIKKFVISSSGNAAVSAAAYCGLAGLELDVFVGEATPEYKIPSTITHPNPLFPKRGDAALRIHKVKRPKSDAVKFARDTGAVNLRGSVDENAVVGFKTLGYEINEQVPEADAIFICCSSGTSTVGVYRGLKLSKIPSNPPLEKGGMGGFHIVQTTKIHSIAQDFDKDYVESENSIANAISDRVAHRKNSIIEIINKTNGSGWIVSDDDIKMAKEILVSKGIEVEGYNAYVGFAGYLKAIKNGLHFDKPVVLITGV